MRLSTPGSKGPMLRAMSSRRRRLTWLEVLLLAATTNILIVAVGAALVMRTDPDRYPRFATGVWWAVSTITTVGYGDVVPVSDAGARSRAF
jgi:voltage-gated potassium channel